MNNPQTSNTHLASGISNLKRRVSGRRTQLAPLSILLAVLGAAFYSFTFVSSATRTIDRGEPLILLPSQSKMTKTIAFSALLTQGSIRKRR